MHVVERRVIMDTHQQKDGSIVMSGVFLADHKKYSAGGLFAGTERTSWNRSQVSQDRDGVKEWTKY